MYGSNFEEMTPYSFDRTKLEKNGGSNQEFATKTLCSTSPALHTIINQSSDPNGES